MTFLKNCDILVKTEEERIIVRVEELLNSINFGLSVWVSNVQYNNCINYYDINKVSEGFVCVLLNAVYGYELVDLNERQKNHCAIDLGDTKKGFSIQVTSRTDAAKIRSTLKKFVDNHFENIYPNGVKFFIISNSPVKKERKKWTDFPFFDFGKDIIYPADIVADINKIASSDIAKLERIQSMVSRYVGIGIDRVPDDNQIIEDLVKCFEQMNEIHKYRYSRIYELILNWHKYDSASKGDTAGEIAFNKLLNLFMDDLGRYKILKPLLDECYKRELDVKKIEGEKLLNDLIGAETPDGTHSKEFPTIKQRYFNVAIEFDEMLKSIINIQLEELLRKASL